MNFLWKGLSFLLFVSTATALSTVPIDKVVFSWIDEMGVSQSVTDSEAPWSLPKVVGNDYAPLPYFTTTGKKRITATAYYLDRILKSEVLEFDIVDSRIGRCDNLIKNADMSLGYQGYWSPSARGVLAIAKIIFGKSVLAIRHTRPRLTTGGPIYISGNLDNSCLTRGSTWEVNSQIALLSGTKGVACTVGKSCPTAIITITDSAGAIVTKHIASKYVGVTWKSGSFNNLKSLFTLPKSDKWNGSIGSVKIEISGHNGSADYVLDSFSLLRKV
jgi:hypothetical protein